MNKSFVSLPSGRIINLDNVAWISATPEADERKKKISIAFCATFSMSSRAEVLHMELDEADSNALLWELSGREVDISALRDKTGSKMIDLNVLNKGPEVSE